MPNRRVDFKKVANVADKLRKSGLEPSVNNVCEQLGNYTATTEVSGYLEQWYRNLPEFERKKQTPLTENIHITTIPKKSNAELEKSLSLLRATLECTADGIMMVNGHGQVVDWNQKFVEMWRIPSHLMEAGPEQLSFDYILGQLTNPEKVISDVEFLYKNPEWMGELPEIYFKDGRIFERYTQPQKVGDEIVGRVYSFRDITQKKMANDELKIREQAIEASAHGIAIIDVSREDNPIIYTNPSFETITGFNEDVVIGKPFQTFYANQIEDANQGRIELAIRERHEENVELELVRKDGNNFWCELSVAPVKSSSNQVRHFIFILNDITQRKLMEQQLLDQATHDSLTGLPNRVILMDRVEQSILKAKKQGSIFGLLFLDIDRFKMTNDTLGHSVGDKLLQAVANQLLIATNEFDTVVRYGGDEFVIVLSDVLSIYDIEQVAKRILSNLDQEFSIDKHQIKITASMGISIFPKDGKDYETLMKNADLSMYHAKDNGRNTYRVFEHEMNQRVINHVQMDTAIRSALINNELHLVYQPIIDLKAHKVTGLEALLRWVNPVLGNVAPMTFIPITEENGTIVEIGEWVLDEACKQAALLHQKGFHDLTVSVNLSGRQLHQTKLSHTVRKILKHNNLPPHFLELELTETLLIDNIDYAVKIMYQLKDLGVKISIDDFGTGYSSLSYLKQFPVDKLKIDRSFIKEIANDNNASIVRAIIDLGHSLGLSVLAEGVEENTQREFITEHDCDFVQGYFYSPPKTLDIIEDYLKTFSKNK